VSGKKQFSFDVGHDERHSVSILWNSMVWGDFHVLVGDKEVLHKRIFFESPKTHIHTLNVGQSEVHSVVIERGPFNSGSPFRVLVDGAPINLEG